MTPNKPFFILAGVALWMPLLFSFLGALSVNHVPGVPASQLLMVVFLILATLLLGMLIGRTATPQAN